MAPAVNFSPPGPEVLPRPEQPRPALKRKGRWETGPSVPRYGSGPQPAPFVITPNPSPEKTDFQLKYEALRAKACSNQRLSPQEWDLFKLLQQDVYRLPSSKEQATHSSATNISLNMANILAFAQVNPSAKELFHKDTKYMWSCSAKQKAVQAKTIIKIHLDHLIREDASFSLCIHS